MPPDIAYDTLRGRWVVMGSDDLPKEYIPDSQTLITGKYAYVGTTPLTNVGTNAVAVATMTGITCQPGDKIVANPKAALAAVVGLGDVRVATNNVVVVKFINPGIALAGSQAAVGWDVLVVRSE